ncbi:MULTISPECIES: hypothetical protein [unclassified Marinimicrobium]|uniref:hypothetical protein n=1 Tax=Marinimicrobium TaxID=359337 RepID=UPI0025809770|nr:MULTISPECIES: hypothetical protein [unclassified Marinimicrobium]
MLAVERDRDKFRWLLGAFLNGCYGFLEFKATYLYYAFCDPDSGEPVEDREALETLRKYVKVSQKKNISGFIKTSGLSELMKKLYKFRNRSTHDGGIEIMEAGNQLPDDFQIGMYKSKGYPAVEFCEEVLSFLRDLDLELES